MGINSPELYPVLCAAGALLFWRREGRKLGPAIVALARQSAKTGGPIVRAMEWEWPHLGMAAVKDQSLLGDDSSTVAGPAATETKGRLSLRSFSRLQAHWW